MQEPCEKKTIGNRSYQCSFELTLDVTSGKWKLLIIYYLSKQKALRFGELRACLPEITERMLVKQLRALESDMLITRTVFNRVPPHVEYSLTDIGLSLIPVMQQLLSWGEMYEQKIMKNKSQ